MKTTQSLLTLITLVSALGLLSACQPSSGKKDDQKLSYEFEYNGCNTGTHAFKSLAEYCDGLRDNDLNKGCATNLRAQEYAVRCESEPQDSNPHTPQSKKDEITATVLYWESSQSTYTNSTAIAGSMIVDSFSDTSAIEYNFATAKNLSATSDDGHCLVQATFEPAKIDKMLNFTILVQQSHSQTYSCANVVETSLRQGTFLDLTDVTVKYKNGKYGLKNVIFHVNTKN